MLHSPEVCINRNYVMFIEKNKKKIFEIIEKSLNVLNKIVVFLFVVKWQVVSKGYNLYRK